jgi:hypothetical protein
MTGGLKAANKVETGVLMRYTGGGNYAGVSWCDCRLGGAQSLRREESIYYFGIEDGFGFG